MMKIMYELPDRAEEISEVIIDEACITSGEPPKVIAKQIPLEANKAE